MNSISYYDCHIRINTLIRVYVYSNATHRNTRLLKVRIKSRASATYRRNCPSHFMINGATDTACTTRKRLASRLSSWVRLSFWPCVMRLKRRWRIVTINQCIFTHPPPSPLFVWRWTMSVLSGLNSRLTMVKSRGVCVRDLFIFLWIISCKNKN